jgi:hypothetical protein
MFQTFNASSWHFSMFLLSSCYSSSCTFWSKTCICSTRHVRHTFLIFEQIQIFLSSAQTVSSNRDFGVEQFFRADEFWADDPSPLKFQLLVVLIRNYIRINIQLFNILQKLMFFVFCVLCFVFCVLILA